jgi:aminoglycoside phosphotransferase (APT) family kinase protein
MAALNAAQKSQVYRILYRLNLSFARIVDSCRELQGTGVFRSKFTRLYQAFAQELQAEINEEVLAILHDIETDDVNRFGKVRDARDKELRDPDDVFIRAKERRRELAEQRKKHPRGNKPAG